MYQDKHTAFCFLYMSLDLQRHLHIQDTMVRAASTVREAGTETEVPCKRWREGSRKHAKEEGLKGPTRR